MNLSGDVGVQDQLEARGFMNIQLLHSMPINSCKSVRVFRGLISVQSFQLIHAHSCFVDSVGVHFAGTCTKFFTPINENIVKAVEL